jgi:hypothetical protein
MKALPSAVFDRPGQEDKRFQISFFEKRARGEVFLLLDLRTSRVFGPWPRKKAQTRADWLNSKLY